LIVNLDARQKINPQKLGSGVKLWEASASEVPRVLPYLIQETDSSGGGDPRVRLDSDDFEDTEALLNAERQSTEEKYSMLGAWAGDRVVFLGDYTERTTEDGTNLYQKASKDFEDVSRTVAKEVRDFLGDKDLAPKVPQDPEECDHEDMWYTEFADNDEIWGEGYCRDCHKTIEFDEAPQGA